MGVILTQNQSILEKMNFSGITIFVSEATTVMTRGICNKQNVIYGKMLWAISRILSKQLPKIPPMLRYLNGNTQRERQAEREFARELQELFTIGKG